jgi:PKD repeat protein
MTASHTYPTAGTYTARLTVTDNRTASSSTTTTIQVNPNTTTIPVAPSNLVATAVSKTQIDLAWTDNATNEDGFKIERCSGASCANFSQIATVSANVRNYSNSGLKRNTTYRFRVRAFNGTGNSAYSNIVTVKTPR